jgi:hypothetical protein
MKKLLSCSSIAALVAVLSGFSSVPRKETAAQAPLTWNEYWVAHGVNKPPPRNFLEAKFNGTIQNLSNGKLSDTTARRWALADLRRGRGDLWAAEHLRLDIVNAGVLGPPGLNGTGAHIESELAKGVVRLETGGALEIVTVAVIDVEEILGKSAPKADVPKFMCVFVYRATGKGTKRTFKDGRVEAIEAHAKAGDLSWQVDTGWFFDDPALGPLWYQEHGWACVPNDGSVTGKICGMVKP